MPKWIHPGGAADAAPSEYFRFQFQTMRRDVP